MTEDDLKGKSLAQLLDLLNEVPEPAPVSMMPQTPGWIVLAVVLSVAVVYCVRTIRRRIRENAYRKAALSELSHLSDDPAKIATLLRRTALAAYPRDQVAGLYGQDWLNFLDHSFDGTGFVSGPGQILTTAAYRDTPGSPDITALAQRWIKTHKPAKAV